MTQEERWMRNYHEVMEYMESKRPIFTSCVDPS